MKQKKFKFKLQSILEIKLKAEEEEKEKLAKLFQKLTDAEKMLERLKQEEINTKEESNRKQRAGKMDVDSLKMSHFHLKKLESLIISQHIYIKDINIAINKQRENLIKATQERKAYEKLKEKHLEVFLEEAVQEERKFIDELATIRHYRAKKEAKENEEENKI